MKSNTTSDRPTTVLDEFQTKRLLKQYAIPVVAEQLSSDIDQAIAAAHTIGYPVVLKALGVGLHHKSEKGLVHLHLRDDAAVRQAGQEIQVAAGDDLEAFVVQPYVTGQRELLAGLFRDPQFGPVIMVGLGGVLAEALEQTALGLAPLTDADAAEMLNELGAKKLMADFRGESAVDRRALIHLLGALSRLAMEHPHIAELDINPLRITPNGALCAVDALAVIQEPAPFSTKVAAVPPHAIGALFYPRSIVFVGASSQFGKWGYLLPSNTIAGGYGGEIYMVNPKGGQMFGHQVYTDLSEIPHPIDLAVVTIPAHAVPDLIPQCKNKGVKYMVLVSSGFAETGPEGQTFEKQLVSAAKEAGLLILGPNTMGVANPHKALYCCGSSSTPLSGGTAMVTQSGNMGTQLLAFAERQGIGIRGFCGSGNEAMITIEDYLEGFEKDDLTHTVVLYVESVKNGRRFFESARRVSRKKPIILLKGGQTDAGKAAATSHTGALTSDRSVFNAMCRQAGIVKVEQPMELLDLAAAFSSVPLPKGARVAIMTWGGGWGVVTADLCHQNGLEVPHLTETVMSAIDKLLPPYWSHSNPVDMVGEQDPVIPMQLLESLACWEGCDAVINLGVMGRRLFLERMFLAAQKSDPQLSPEFLDQLRSTIIQFEKAFIAHSVALMDATGKPIIGVSLLADPLEKTIHRVTDATHRGLFFDTPERAVYALAKMLAYRRHLET